MKWGKRQLGDLAEIQSGFGFPREEQGRTDQDIPFYKVGDMNLPGNETEMQVRANTVSRETLKSLGGRAFPAGTTIFPKIGAAIATEKKRILVEEATYDNNVMGLIPRAGVEGRFLFYWSRSFRLMSVANIGPVPSIRKSEMERVDVPYFPHSEQRRIVELLDQADALRKQRAEADQLADRILPALFLKLFGDPTSLAGRDGARPLASWGIEVQNGFACGDKDVSDGLPHMRMNNIDDHGRLNLDLIRTVPRDYADEKYELRGGDVLFMGTNSEEKVGKCCVFSQPDHRRWYYSNHLARLRNSEMHSTPEFLAVYLHQLWRAGFYRSRMKRWVNQAAMNADAIRAIPLSPVNIELAKDFSSKYWTLNTMHERRISAEATIKMQFEVMLQRALTGDLTAKWREAHMKELLQEMEQQARYLRQSAGERIET